MPQVRRPLQVVRYTSIRHLIGLTRADMRNARAPILRQVRSPSRTTWTGERSAEFSASDPSTSASLRAAFPRGRNLGEAHHLFLLLEGERLIAKASGNANVSSGELVHVRIDPAWCHLFFDTDWGRKTGRVLSCEPEAGPFRDLIFAEANDRAGKRNRKHSDGTCRTRP